MDCLSHPNRMRIAGLLAERGCETASGLARRSGLARATVNHHLRVLQKAGAVRRVAGRGKGVPALFIPSRPPVPSPLWPGPPGVPAAAAPFANPRVAPLVGASAARRALVSTLRSVPEAGIGDLLGRLAGEGLSVTRPTLHHHLGVLVRAGLVARAVAGGRVRFAWRGVEDLPAGAISAARVLAAGAP